MVSKRSPFKLPTLILLVLLVSACGNDAPDPETQLRETVDAIQQAAESRKLADLMSHVSGSYLDDDGRDIRQLRAIAQFQFLRNPKIHSFKVIKSLNLIKENEAEISLLVAVASTPIDGAVSLATIRADMMRFDLRFRLDDQWKLIAALWRPAGSADFL